MKTLIKKLKSAIFFLCTIWGFTASAQQGNIDQNFNFSGSFNRMHGTESCLFTAHQQGNTVTGRINFSNPRVQGNYTGTITNGVVHATITWVAAPNDLTNATYLSLQKFNTNNYVNLSFYDNIGYKTNNRIRSSVTYALEKKVFNTTTSNNRSNVSPIKDAKKIGGFYLIEGLVDAKGIKRDIYVEVKDIPNSSDRTKSMVVASIIGHTYDLGNSRKFFQGTADGDNINVIIDLIFEQNIRTANAKGRVAELSTGLHLVAPKFNYPMKKVTEVIARSEGNKLSQTVKIRVDYKFIYLPSTAEWPQDFLKELSVIKPALALYGTGSIRADRETASGSTQIKSVDNLADRVFDIPKSRVVEKGERFYFDSQKNLAWGKNKRFYKFSKDAELDESYHQGDKSVVRADSKGVAVNPSAIKEINNYTREYIIKVDFKREFIVNRAALEGKTERVAITAHSHLSHKLPVRDIVFGNKHRKVYLHELGVINKLNNKEKFQNDIHDADNKRIGVSLDPPIYYFTDVDNGPMIAFTIEIID